MMTGLLTGQIYGLQRLNCRQISYIYVIFQKKINAWAFDRLGCC